MGALPAWFLSIGHVAFLALHSVNKEIRGEADGGFSVCMVATTGALLATELVIDLPSVAQDAQLTNLARGINKR